MKQIAFIVLAIVLQSKVSLSKPTLFYHIGHYHHFRYKFSNGQRSGFAGPIGEAAMIGKSYNSGNSFIGPIILAKTKLTPTNAIPSIKSYVRVFTSENELVSQYNLDMEASFKFGLYSGSASYQKIHNLSLTKYHKYVVFHAIKTDSILQVANYDFKAPFGSQVHEKPSDFVNSKGDQIITGEVKGAELSVIIEVENSSSTETKTEMDNIKLAYSGLSNAAAGGVDVKKAEEVTAKTSLYHIQIIGTGIAGTGQETYTLDAATRLMKGFFSPTNQTVLAYITTPLSTLVTIPKVALLDIETLKGNMNTLQTRIDSIKDQQSNLEFALENSDEFDPLDVEKARVLHKSNVGLLRKLEVLKNSCAIDNQSCNKGIRLEPKEINYAPIFLIKKKQPYLKLDGRFHTIDIIRRNGRHFVSFRGIVQYTDVDGKINDLKKAYGCTNMILTPGNLPPVGQAFPSIVYELGIIDPTGTYVVVSEQRYFENSIQPIPFNGPATEDLIVRASVLLVYANNRLETNTILTVDQKYECSFHISKCLQPADKEDFLNHPHELEVISEQ